MNTCMSGAGGMTRYGSVRGAALVPRAILSQVSRINSAQAPDEFVAWLLAVVVSGAWRIRFGLLAARLAR